MSESTQPSLTKQMLTAARGAAIKFGEALCECVDVSWEASCYREERERERPVYTLNREMRQRIAQLKLALINTSEELIQLRAESEAACSDAPEWAKTWRRAWRTLKKERSKNIAEQRKLREQIEWLKAELAKARASGNT